MWNPYNVSITSSPLDFNLVKTLPNAFKFQVGAVSNANYNSISASENYNSPSLGGGALTFGIASSYTFKPGETLLFSPDAAAVAPGTKLNMVPGFRKQGGHLFPLKKDDGTTFSVAPGTSVKADAKFDAIYNDLAVGVGIYLDMSIAGARHLAYRMVYDPALASSVYKPIPASHRPPFPSP
jgi:hypothetical protein